MQGTAVVVEVLQLDFLERDNMLLVVFALRDHDVAVDDYVVEEEELALFALFATHL